MLCASMSISRALGLLERLAIFLVYLVWIVWIVAIAGLWLMTGRVEKSLLVYAQLTFPEDRQIFGNE